MATEDHENVEKFPLQETYAIKLLKVPVEHDLYVIINALKGKLQSVMSIYRIFDYINQQRCNEVVIIIRSELEYLALKDMKKVLIGAQDVELDFPVSYFGSANCSKYITDTNQWNIGASPFSLKFSKLNEVSRVTTVYLGKILLAFESTDNRDVTGITFCYDNKRDAIRPFGFVSFSNLNSMLQFHGKRVRLWDEFVNCEGSNQVPFLLSKPNMILLREDSKSFTLEIAKANQLNAIQCHTNELEQSLSANLNEMQIEEGLDDQMSDSSDSDSVLSLDCDYNFDEN